MKATKLIKKQVLAILVGGHLLAVSGAAHALLGDPLPHTVVTFNFEGSFTMTGSDGTMVPNATPAVSGTMMLDTVTFGGSAAMSGVFFNNAWSADGAFSAYPGTGLVPNVCNGAPMCAHANISFLYSGLYFPVPAAFGMTPMFALTDLSNLIVGNQFSVESLDTEPDGYLGTAMTSDFAYKKKDGSAVPNIFKGYTPAFTGIATVVDVNPLGTPIDNQNIYIAPVPEPSEWAMLLVGVGIVGAMGYRRKTRTAEV